MEVRAQIVQRMIEEFVGPGSEGVEDVEVSFEEEVISESPLYRYFLGVLYPQKFFESNLEQELIEGESSAVEVELEDHSVLGRRTTKKAILDLEEEEDANIGSDIVKDIYAFAPSACSMTFIVESNCRQLDIDVSSAKYQSLKKEDKYVQLSSDEESILQKYSKVGSFELRGKKLFFKQFVSGVEFFDSTHKKVYDRVLNKAYSLVKSGYQRIPINFSFSVKIEEHSGVQEIKVDEEKLKLKLKLIESSKEKIIITVSLVNHLMNKKGAHKHNPELCYFQSKIKVTVPPSEQNCAFQEIDDIQIGDLDDYSDKMLFGNKKIFAVGHGCSVTWEGNSPRSLETTFTPIHIAPPVSPNPERIQDLGLEIFNLQHLGWSDNKAAVIRELNRFVEDYKEWLEDEYKGIVQLEEFKQSAEKNYVDCCEIIRRIRSGIDILITNADAWQAFQDANKAMLMQKYQSDNFLDKIDDGFIVHDRSTTFNFKDTRLEFKWRPFQLAFLLLSIRSIVEPRSPDRAIADLIWFPTGGGKTEAYLGLIAFTIFYNRKTDKKCHGSTMIIMRYTLRLLTADQFKRASTLILACEYIRREKPLDYGTKEISIGFWVGSDVTNNKLEDAIKDVGNFMVGITRPDEFIQKYKLQITHCPWCGSSLINKEYPVNSGFIKEERPKKLGFKCTNPHCKFRDNLPFQVIDEVLYINPPTLLFGTVDKFAILAWRPETRSFFGFVKNKNGDISREHTPPALIIQDELHLISSALGSVFGHYESVIDFLCTEDDIVPKVVCSTATIKRATEQVQDVFNREMAIFPPPVFRIENSYFAQEININADNPGRMYVGFCSIGKTLSTTFIKLISSLLLHRNSNSNRSYSTIVSYFNTIRDIGQAAGFMDDSVEEQLEVIANRRGKEPEKLRWEELTSRLKGNELPGLLRKLKNSNDPLSVVLTTNMFSVGIDIPTLNMMIMNGQPKSTSEYIQATSRVGRQGAGLVLTLFDNYRPRDKSHYENFKAYHQSFYRFVEPSGVTPFSRPVRNRALHALVIIIIRMFLLDDNSSASSLDLNKLEVNPFWNRFRQHIRERCNKIDEKQTTILLTEIEEFLMQWINWARNENFVFSNRRFYNNQVQFDIKQNPLMMPAGVVRAEWENRSKQVMESMRNVDSTTRVILED